MSNKTNNNNNNNNSFPDDSGRDGDDDDDLDILSNAKKYVSTTTSVTGRKRSVEHIAPSLHSDDIHQPPRKLQKIDDKISDINEAWDMIDKKLRKKEMLRERIVAEMCPGTPVFAYIIARCKQMWHSFMHKYISPFMTDHNCLDSCSPASLQPKGYTKTVCEQRKVRLRVFINDDLQTESSGQQSLLCYIKNACICLFDYHSGVHICSHPDNALFHPMSEADTGKKYLYFDNDDVHFCSLTGRMYICGDLCRMAHSMADKSTQYQATCPLTGTIIHGDSIMVNSKLWRNWDKVSSQSSSSHTGSKLIAAGTFGENVDYDARVDDVALYSKMATWTAKLKLAATSGQGVGDAENVRSENILPIEETTTTPNKSKPEKKKKKRTNTKKSSSIATTTAATAASSNPSCVEELTKFVEARNSSTKTSSNLQFKPLWLTWDKKYPLWQSWLEDTLQMSSFKDIARHLVELEHINYLYVCGSKDLFTRFSVLVVFSMFCDERYKEEKNCNWKQLVEIANREAVRMENNAKMLDYTTTAPTVGVMSESGSPGTVKQKQQQRQQQPIVFSRLFHNIINTKEKDRRREQASTQLIVSTARNSMLRNEARQMVPLGSKFSDTSNSASAALALSTTIANTSIARQLVDTIVSYGRKYFLMWTEVCRLSWEITMMERKQAMRKNGRSAHHESEVGSSVASTTSSFPIPLLFFIYAMMRKASSGIMYSSIDNFADSDDYVGCYILREDETLGVLLPKNWKCISEVLYDRHSVSRVYDSTIKIITTAVSMGIINHDHFLVLDTTWEDMKFDLNRDPWFSSHKYKKLLRGPVAATKKRVKSDKQQ